MRRSRYIKDIFKMTFTLISKLPIRKKTIVFESFLGKQYSDNPKALYLYIKRHYPDYRLYWSVDRRKARNFDKKKLTVFPRFGLKWLLIMPRAEYWITNSRLPLWVPKPKGTTYVQTWHGTPLKRLATDIKEIHMPGTNTAKYKKNFLKEVKRWDYLISPNAYSTEIFKNAFQFQGKVIESGYPRNDILLNENDKKTVRKLKKSANLPLDKKIILYAPTWRDNQFYRVGKYKFDLKLDLNKLKETLEGDYVIILRFHYLVAEHLDLSKYEGFAIDFSQYEDINELYLMSDILITDYSSTFFDFANLKRPILFFVHDLEEYRDKVRGFYFNLEESAPGPLAKTTEQLITQLKEMEKNQFQMSENFDAFHRKYCYLEDGYATERVKKTLFK